VCAYLRIIVLVGEDEAELAALGTEAGIILTSIAEAPRVVVIIRLELHLQEDGAAFKANEPEAQTCIPNV
jgi:hypothetical protein